jgi:long-chain acyl-CoA synthetase
VQGIDSWWRANGALHRFVSDLVADELVRQRRGALPTPLPWSPALRLDADLGVDSLELMGLATSLAEALHLHESGIEDYLLARRTVGEWVEIAHAGLAQFDERLTFRTSGSSGVPKPCVHALATLRQETAHLAWLFPGRRRILSAVPAHHIYGFLFTVLLPQDLHLAESAVIDIRGSTPAWLARGAQAGDLVVGHPDFWQAVGRAVPALPPDVVGVTSTAPCPDHVSEAVEATGLARLVHVYGASETAGIASRDSHRAPYELFPYWRLEGEGALVRRLPQGGEQAFQLQDRLEPESDRFFRVAGRRDEAVQVGGINVFTARVREVLCRHPAVADAAVRLMTPEEGTRLKAFVVPKDGIETDDELMKRLRAWIDQELSAAERPKAIRFGERLLVRAAGKLADWSA